jgi:uncharacterized metal-binding protein YceD (DUF177 family)
MIETPPEFSRPIDRRQIMQKPVHLVATEAERAALARRFGVVSLSRLEATMDLYLNGEEVAAKGRMSADLVQACAVSGADLAQTIDEALDLKFVPEQPIEAEELELEEHQLDEITYTGTTFDLGEAVAQSVGLAIDPYAVGPDADRVRREKGLLDESAAGPFAALAALKKDG